mmetsp:Transcript_39329/g.77382  ORF Transcript_39329/g.77382 Transcript_39329/m.77382 type:complete len:123 (-) Transcript_39329:290-658(-)
MHSCGDIVNNSIQDLMPTLELLTLIPLCRRIGALLDRTTTREDKTGWTLPGLTRRFFNLKVTRLTADRVVDRLCLQGSRVGSSLFSSPRGFSALLFLFLFIIFVFLFLFLFSPRTAAGASSA